MNFKISDEELEKVVAPFKEDIDRIAALEDYFQQGYEAAPVLCKISDITPVQLAASVQLFYDPEDHPVNLQRDDGILQWCREQSANES